MSLAPGATLGPDQILSLHRRRRDGRGLSRAGSLASTARWRSRCCPPTASVTTIAAAASSRKRTPPQHSTTRTSSPSTDRSANGHGLHRDESCAARLSISSSPAVACAAASCFASRFPLPTHSQRRTRAASSIATSPGSSAESDDGDNPLSKSKLRIGWEAGIRTPITWSRATCPTVERPPSSGRSRIEERSV